MANPNIFDASTITAKTVGAAVTASAVALVTNAASSNKIIKLNALVVSSISTVSATITVDIYKNQATAFRVAFAIVVPANSTLVVFSKDTALYLEENDSLRITANATGALEAVCSYEEIS